MIAITGRQQNLLFTIQACLIKECIIRICIFLISISGKNNFFSQRIDTGDTACYKIFTGCNPVQQFSVTIVEIVIPFPCTFRPPNEILTLFQYFVIEQS